MLDNAEEIYSRANSLVRKYGTRDPFRLADCTGVDIIRRRDFTSLLGMYAVVCRNRVIFLKDGLDGNLARAVVAHELGHDVFHRDLAKRGLIREYGLFNMKSETEYTANAFAAHVLIDTDEFLSLAREGRGFAAAARMLYTEPDLLLIKIRELRRMGFDIRLPEEPDGEFLAGIGRQDTVPA